MANAPGVPIERLLAQRDWVRALARTLVRDEAGADDLEQQAWLEAIESPPSHGRSLRGWFATVLRRRARDAWRSEHRRDRRESEASRPDVGRPTADLVAEAEAQRRVVDALLALEEPYREVLLLRFYEDLAPSDIARRQGIPRETVKTRLRRALELLRGALAHRNGGAWRLAVVPLAGRPEGGGIGIPGGVLVKASTKAAVAAAALLALGVSWWLLRPGDPLPTPSKEVAGAPIPARDTPPVRESASGDLADPAPAPAPAAAVAAVPALPAFPVPRAVGRDRLPLVGAVSETPPAGGRIDIVVDAKGRVTVDGRELGMAALLALLKERADGDREEAKPNVSRLNAVLRVDRDLPWVGAQWLMQACAGPDIRIDRVQFAAVPDSGGEEGVVPTFLPRDPGALAAQAAPDLVEEGGAGGEPEGGRKAPDPLPRDIRVKVTRASGGRATPRDLLPYLERKFPEPRTTGLRGNLDAPPSVPAGDVLAVVEALVRAGVKSITFKGTRSFEGDSLEAALAGVPRAEGDLEITVEGESIVPR